MRNVKLKNGEFSYDCTAPDCATPGQPHVVSTEKVMASLDLALQEFVQTHDPRTEGLAVALQFMYQTFYSVTDDGAGVPDDIDLLPWEKEYSQLKEEIEDYYSPHDHAHDGTPKKNKKLLN